MRLGFALSMLVAVLPLGAPSARAAADPRCDFDGDGFGDVAIGAPNEDIGAETLAGSVHILYGSSRKLGSDRSQIWSQDSPGLANVAEHFDAFGSALACGDFNGDRFTDLAIGSPGETIKFGDFGGAVHVLYGSKSGLRSKDSDFIHRDIAGIAGEVVAFASFGKALAAGDFDGDGHDDLAVGAPGDTVDLLSEAGSIQIFRGGPNGLRKAGDKIIHRARKGIKGGPATFGGFGDALTEGDFNGDGIEDLAIGAPGDIIDGLGYAGSVSVLYGSISGLTKSGDQLFHRNVKGVAGGADALDRFGWDVAGGDFDNDGYDDLAVAVPFDEVGSATDAGSIQVFPGGPDGLTKSGDVIFNRDTPGVRGTPGLDDRFGYGLTVARFDEGGRDDLAIGVVRDDVGSVVDAGSAHVLYGSASGLSGKGDQVWHRGISGVKGEPGASDWLGYEVGSGDFDGDGRGDLVIGAPLADAGSQDAGDVSVLYGTDDGLGKGGDQLWSQESPGIGANGQNDDRFGWAITG